MHLRCCRRYIGLQINTATNAISNLICTNIATNDEAADKITFWIDDCLYQVKKTEDGHDIFQIK